MVRGRRQSIGHVTDPELALFPFDDGDTWLVMLRAAEEPGELGTLGPYKLISEVARGGQGVVYRAFDPSMKRYVALKVLRAGRLAPASVIARFQRELEATSRLEHPSIVVLYSAEMLDNELALVMRWVDGLPFVQWANAPGRDVRDVVGACICVCQAIQHAHQRGVIHRDLKPTNVLVDADGHPYVLDFGLAKFETQDQAHITRDGQFLGTAEYAAPEQLTHGAVTADVRSDVYALGLMFSKSWQRLGDKNRDLEAIASHATNYEPEDRYPSADALQTDLSAWLDGRPVSARRMNALERLARVIRRRPVASLAVALTVTSLIALTVFLGIQTSRYRAEAERSSALQRLFAEALTPRDGAWSFSSMTVAEVLNRSAARLDEAVDVPEITRAQLHQALAEKFDSFHMWEQADSHARKAIEIGETQGREVWPVLIGAYKTRGIFAIRQGDKLAVRYSGKFKSYIEAVHGSRSPQYADALAKHACAGWQVGAMDPEEIERLIENSLQLYNSLPSANLEGRAATLNIWAKFLAAHERSDEAVAALAEAQSLLAEIPEPGDRKWTQTVVSHALLLNEREQFGAAKVVTMGAITDARKRGNELSEARLLWLLGELYVSSESYDEPGLPVLSEAIDMRLEVVAPEMVGKSDDVRWGTLFRLGTDRLMVAPLFAITYAKAQFQAGHHSNALALVDRQIEMVSGNAAGPNTLAGKFTHLGKLMKAEMLIDLKRYDQARAVLGSLRDQIDALPANHATRWRVEHMLSAIELAPASLSIPVPANKPQAPD